MPRLDSSSPTWEIWGIHHQALTDLDLEALCTDECAAGLDTWARQVSGACDGTQVLARKYPEAFDYVCLRDQ